MNVIRVLLQHIIPRFEVEENIYSDNGSYFTPNFFKGVLKAIEVKLEYHAPWHPASSGTVERMNQT
jgi:hypothetical protein